MQAIAGALVRSASVVRRALCLVKTVSFLVLPHFLHELAGDHELLDLGRAFVDTERANVAIEALDYAAAHEAGTAVNLYRAVDDSPRRFGRGQ